MEYVSSNACMQSGSDKNSSKIDRSNSVGSPCSMLSVGGVLLPGY